MQFDLTDALMDEILFFMEDQNGDFFLDTVEGVIAGGIEGLEFYFEENPDIDRDDDSRFIDLPEWDSSDGFRLMEQFSAAFRNPMIRNDLKAALNHGRGVFRAFKNTLGRYPEAEKLWHTYKANEMKKVVITWYNGLREEWGLEEIGLEPEETDDLVLEDFRFRPFNNDDIEKAKSLHNLCMEEFKKNLVESGAKNSAEVLIRETLTFHHSLDIYIEEEPSLIHSMAAETVGGEFAGYVSGVLLDSILYIQSLEVKAEYLGLGIGESLLQKFIESFDSNELDQVLLDLPSWAEGFSRFLLRESFHPYAVRYRLNPRDRLG